MVHALKKAALCLKEGGIILNVHDLIDPPRIEVHTESRTPFAGQLFSDDDFANQRNTDQAINQAISDGLFTSERSLVFESYIRADSFESLETWLAESWESAYIPEDTREKIVDLTAQMGGENEVALRFVSRLMELKPN